MTKHEKLLDAYNYVRDYKEKSFEYLSQKPLRKRILFCKALDHGVNVLGTRILKAMKRPEVVITEKNVVPITKCIECHEWTPADSCGIGVYCDELQKVLSKTEDDDFLIPDECPKLKD